MLMDEYFRCPVCLRMVQLVARSTHFDSKNKSPLFWRKNARKGICKQLDETGEVIMIHFVVEYHQEAYDYRQAGKRYTNPGGKMVGHNKWMKI